ncbi:MAG: hypothetical protein AB8E15_08585, partial [Bdellovibrionales bacterium]
CSFFLSNLSFACDALLGSWSCKTASEEKLMANIYTDEAGLWLHYQKEVFEMGKFKVDGEEHADNSRRGVKMSHKAFCNSESWMSFEWNQLYEAFGLKVKVTHQLRMTEEGLKIDAKEERSGLDRPKSASFSCTAS